MEYKEFIENILNTRGRFGIPQEEYKEKHHILPKCLGGGNEINNLIDLYPEEHYEAHKLLAEEHSDVQGLLYARFMMGHGGGSSKKREKQNNIEYAEARKKYSHYLSEHNKKENNPNYGNSILSGTNNPMFGVDRKGEKSYWFGKKRDENTIKKIVKTSCKKILQKDDEGNLINTFESAAEASRVTGICYQSIKDVAGKRGRSKRAGGYRWEYDSVDTSFNNYKNKSVAQLDENENLISVYESIIKASINTGINKSSISHVCNGIQGRKTAGGYKWKFVEK